MTNFPRKIYIAAPLFCESERWFNEKIDAILRSLGHETYLPQRDGGCYAELPELIDGRPKEQVLYEKDIAALNWCDTLLFLPDGRVPDEGACFELGYAAAQGKDLVAYKTDARAFMMGMDNLMLRMAVSETLRDEEQLREWFSLKERMEQDESRTECI